MPLQCPLREGLDSLSDAWRARWCTLWPCQWSVASWRKNEGKRRHAPRYGPAYERGARNRQGAGPPLSPPSVFPMWGFMWGISQDVLIYVMKSMMGGGETGIRTLGRLSPSTVFETAPFDHSGTSPQDRSIIFCVWGCKRNHHGFCASSYRIVMVRSCSSAKLFCRGAT